MLASIRRLRRPIVLACFPALFLSGCEGMDPSMLQNLPGDVMGGLSDIRNIGSNPGDFHNIDRIIRLVATVHRYAALTAVQRQRVEVTVARHYDGMVAKEKRSLSPQYAKRKAEVKKQGAVRVAEAKKKSPSSAAKVEAETEKEVKKVDLEWEKAAKSSVAKNYGTDFAVPVTSSEGKPVVAFASVKDSGVQVSDSSYIADKSGSLAGGSQVKHDGKTYAVLD